MPLLQPRHEQEHFDQLAAGAQATHARLQRIPSSSHHRVVVVDAHKHVIGAAHHPLWRQRRRAHPGGRSAAARVHSSTAVQTRQYNAGLAPNEAAWPGGNTSIKTPRDPATALAATAHPASPHVPALAGRRGRSRRTCLRGTNLAVRTGRSVTSNDLTSDCGRGRY